MNSRWDEWVHAIINAKGTWLPGDARGFRNRDHRIHSSGDYRQRPPIDEYRGLRKHFASVSGAPVRFPPACWPFIGEALIEKFSRIGVNMAALSVDAVHAHMLIRVGIGDATPVVGRAKQFASHRIRDGLPGGIWSEGAALVRVRDEFHFSNIITYILQHRDAGAWVWQSPELRRASAPASG